MGVREPLEAALRSVGEGECAIGGAAWGGFAGGTGTLVTGDRRAFELASGKAFVGGLFGGGGVRGLRTGRPRISLTGRTVGS